MSYIAFDLDAFDAAESAARHAGASADAMMAGLLRLWRFCWRQRSDIVSADQLRGVFGLDVGPALVAFGFIATAPNGYRVKGADRYLRIQEGRSKGGKAASGNLKQNKKKPADTAGSAPAEHRLPAGSPPAYPPADDRAFSEQRAATSEQRAANKVAPRKGATPTGPPADPRHAPLVAELCEVFQENTKAKYPFGGRDAKAIAALLAIEPVPERISTVWRQALRSNKFPLVRTLPELVINYAHFVGTGPPTNAKGASWTQQQADSGKSFLEGLSDG